MQQAKPLVPWMGGKRRLADIILPLIPPEHLCYVELFVGAGAIFFAKQSAKVEVLNDVNQDLITLYRVVKNHKDEFLRQLEDIPVSRQLFEDWRSIDPKSLTDIQRAARFFYLQHTCFGAQIEGQSFGMATTSCAPRLSNAEQNVAAVQKKIQRAYIEQGSWSKCFERYDREYTFFYADPPYWQTAGYACEFGFDQYELLADKMRNMLGKMMISINDHPDIRAVFEGLTMVEVNIDYTVSGKATPAKELIILNYEPPKSGLF